MFVKKIVRRRKMNVKKLLCVSLVFMAVGTAVLVAQQSWGWNPQGEQCFSLAGVEWYYSTSGPAATYFINHNDYSITVLYTRNGRQLSLWLDAGTTRKIDAKVTVDQCKKE
jgi:hypothetical protein